MTKDVKVATSNANEMINAAAAANVEQPAIISVLRFVPLSVSEKNLYKNFLIIIFLCPMNDSLLPLTSGVFGFFQNFPNRQLFEILLKFYPTHELISLSFP